MLQANFVLVLKIGKAVALSLVTNKKRVAQKIFSKCSLASRLTKKERSKMIVSKLSSPKDLLIKILQNLTLDHLVPNIMIWDWILILMHIHINKNLSKWHKKLIRKGKWKVWLIWSKTYKLLSILIKIWWKIWRKFNNKSKMEQLQNMNKMKIH